MDKSPKAEWKECLTLKVFIAGIVTETNTFSPLPTALHDFEREDTGGGMLAPAFAACAQQATKRGYEATHGIGAFAIPSGPVVRSAYEAMKSELLEGLRAALPVKAVTLILHGAMVADGYDDCEGDLLAAVRVIVGPGTAIGALLDPHAHLTQQMVDNADILVTYKEWPHVDIPERAAEVMDLTLAHAEGTITPHMAVWDCRMLGLYMTSLEPMRSLVDALKAREGHNGILSISIVHGFPWGDVPDAGTKIIVLTDNQAMTGRMVAEAIGRRLIDLRGKTGPKYLPLEAGLDAIQKARHRPLVVADAADMPGGGSAGDCAIIAKHILERGLRDIAIAYIWDPGTVAIAFAAGEGSRLKLRIGGKAGWYSGQPLDLEAEVIHLQRDFKADSHQAQVLIGDVAVIRVEGVDIALSSRRGVAMSASHFERLGIDPGAKRALIVKSAGNHRAGFPGIASAFIDIDALGSNAMDIRKLHFFKLKRPIWPLDPHPLT